MITITIYKYLLMSIETEEISMPGLKYSRQRESIINCLKGRKDHPTADMIYASVREEYPKISLGTVYRNLSLLVDQGEILRFSCGEGQDHYDADTSQHFILYARNAGLFQICICHRWNISMCLQRMVLTVR